MRCPAWVILVLLHVRRQWEGADLHRLAEVEEGGDQGCDEQLQADKAQHLLHKGLAVRPLGEQLRGSCRSLLIKACTALTFSTHAQHISPNPAAGTMILQ